MSVYNLYHVLGIMQIILICALGILALSNIARFVLRDWLGLLRGRDNSLHCSTRFSLSRLKAVFSRLGGGSCNSMPKVKALLRRLRRC